MDGTTIWKVIAFICSTIIILNISAMDADLDESEMVIDSLLMQPLSAESINQLSTEIKKISKPRQQNAANWLTQAFLLLLSENKFAEAQTLLDNLRPIPELNNNIEELEIDLATKISLAPASAPEKAKAPEQDLALEKAAALLIKEPFTLEDAKNIDNIIETARTNKWKINLSQLLEAFIKKIFTSYLAGRLDNSIIPLLSAALKKQFIESEANVRELVVTIFEKMIPTQALKTDVELKRNNEFTHQLLDSLFNEKIINLEQSNRYLKILIKPEIVAPVQPPVVRPPSPAKPTVDLELEPFIKEHSSAKNALENSRIESTDTGDKLVDLFGFSTPVTVLEKSINVLAQQMPALSQLEYRGKAPEDVKKELAIAHTSNYCGYYAAYNLWCIISKQPNNVMNRQLFGEHFGSMLAIVKKNNLQEIEHGGFAVNPEKRKPPYDEIAGYEIEYLLKKEFNIDPSDYLALSAAEGKISSASENIKAHDPRSALLETFRKGPFVQEKIIPILLNVDENHWIAIKAMRLGTDLSFELYDSLGKRNWQDFNEKTPTNTDLLIGLALYLTKPGMN